MLEKARRRIEDKLKLNELVQRKELYLVLGSVVIINLAGHYILNKLFLWKDIVKKIDPYESHPAIAPTASYGEFSFGAFGLERAIAEIKRLQLEVMALRKIIHTHLDSSASDFEERLNDRVNLEIEKLRDELQD